MKVGDLIKSPAGISLITNMDYIDAGYVLAHFLGGKNAVIVFCATLKVISESR